MKIAAVVGARPQFVKAAAVSRAIREHNSQPGTAEIEEVIVHTGQHYDTGMSNVFFKELDIPVPNYNLNVGSGNHGVQTGRMLERIEEVLATERPDVVVVYGDTNSTLAGSLAAAKLHMPVAHVEAGLRSFNRRMPEEINRVVTDHVSTVHLCPTHTAVLNLQREGITKRVYNVGDVMYDAILFYLSRVSTNLTTLRSMNLEPKKFVLATIHRAETTDDPESLSEVLAAMGEIASNTTVLFAVHPRTNKRISMYGIKVPENVVITEPLSYLQMIELESNALVILTDSGGVQKEAFFVRRPCVTVRSETEWVETLEAGANIISGVNREDIVHAFHRQLQREIRTDTPNPFGDGRSAPRVVSVLSDLGTKMGEDIWMRS